MSVVRLRQISQFICVSLFTVCIYLYHHIFSIRGAFDKYEIWVGVDQIKCQSRDSVRSSNLYLVIVTTSVPSDQNCNTRDTRETRDVTVLSNLDSHDNIKEGQSNQATTPVSKLSIIPIVFLVGQSATREDFI